MENAVYNELTGSWMIPQADPYTLENFQKAYDNLASGKSLQTLTRAEMEEFSEPVQLEPTHYALRIYPHNEEEQWRVEMMEDVSVAYAPFNYSGLSAEEIERVPKTRVGILSPFEVNPYIVTYDNYESTDGGTTEPRIFQLPILYAVWPVDKTLPEDLEYKIDYEVFLPHVVSSESVSEESKLILSNEANAMALGVIPASITPQTRGSSSANVHGRVMTYDDVLRKNVPLEYVELQYVRGSVIQETMVGADGYFQFSIQDTYPSPTNLGDIELRVIYRDSGKWMITINQTTPLQSNSYFFSLANAYTTHVLDCGEIVLPAEDRQLNEISRGASYFFNNQYDFPTDTPTGGIKIVANAGSGSFKGAMYWYRNYVSSPWIEIYNYGGTDSQVIGTILHELGHLSHYWYGRSGAYAKYYQETLLGLKEAFSSYAAWYLGESYYTSLGWITPSSGSYFPSGNITGNARQDWEANLRLGAGVGGLGEYMPLFIDLTDSYNQGLYVSSGVPYDVVDGVPPYVVWDLASGCKTWGQCRTTLQSLVLNGYYTIHEFNRWVADFDFWFAQPDNQTL